MYFPEINKLLFEPDFMTYVSDTNAWYLYDTNPEQAEYIEFVGDETFDISLNDWYKFTSENERFKELAIKKLHNYITEDWIIFNEKIQKLALDNPNKFNAEFEAIKNEFIYLKDRINKKEYFKPVATELFSEFDKVIAHYNEINNTPMPATPIPTTTNNTTVGGSIYPVNISPINEPLIWKGGVGSLCTLFHDLRTSKAAKGGNVYLDYTPKQLQDFILKNFVDEKGNPFPPDSVKTYLDPKRFDKKAKRARIDISDLEEE